jgi:type I restriction enzyme S subunit
LDAAFEGLTRARTHVEINLQNARELFEAQRKALLSRQNASWQQMTIDEICIVDRGSSPRPIKKYVTTAPDGVNWIKIGDTKVGSKFVQKTKEKITPQGAEKSRYVAIGDFILTNSMTYGRPYIMATDGFIHDGWFVLRLGDRIESNFLFHALSSEVVQEQFRSLAAGAVVKNISGDLVKKTIVPVPPIKEQVDLAKTMDAASEVIEILEEKYRVKLQDLDDLRQSLLQKAFAGELT